MTNYTKKRKRQNGRQEPLELDRNQIYRDGFFAGQSQVIERMINAGILPSVDFNLERVYRSDDNE